MKKFFAIFILLATFAYADGTSMPDSNTYYRARDVIKESLENGDTATARYAMNFLKEHKAKGALLSSLEEHLIVMKMGNYEEAIHILAVSHKTKYDSYNFGKQPNQDKIEDGLSIYLNISYGSRFLKKEEGDSLIAAINASSIPQKSKDLYAVLIYSELAIRPSVLDNKDIQIKDSTAAKEFLNRAKQFLKQYPNDEGFKYLEKQIIPLTEKSLNKLETLAENPLAGKYYTGGFGFFYSRWHGITKGSATKYIKMEMGTFMLDFELQIHRVDIGFIFSQGVLAEKKEFLKPSYSIQTNDDEDDFGYSLGLTAGFDVFDSRFLKITPFSGVDDLFFESLDLNGKKHFILGTNIDIRPICTTPQSMYDLAIALHLRLRYMAKFGGYSDSYQEMVNPDAQNYSDRFQDRHVKGNYVTHVFSIGLGVFFW